MLGVIIQLDALGRLRKDLALQPVQIGAGGEQLSRQNLQPDADVLGVVGWKAGKLLKPALHSGKYGFIGFAHINTSNSICFRSAKRETVKESWSGPVIPARTPRGVTSAMGLRASLTICMAVSESASRFP